MQQKGTHLASAEIKETFPCTPEQFFKILTDFDSYSTVLPEVKSCKVLKTEGGRKLVEFKVSVIKAFTYNLWITEEAPKRMSWVLESGDIFKTTTGSWELVDKGGKTEATYIVEAEFKVFVPGMVAKALVSVNLPNMMTAYQKRVKELYG